MTSIARVSIVGLATLLLGLSPCAWADSYEFKLLHAFHHTPNSPEGADPQGPLFVAANGSVYGTTSRGGIYGAGIVFKIDGKTGAFQTMHTFSGIDGLAPDPCLLAGKDGNFYGSIGVQYRSVYRVGRDGSFATVLAYPQSPDPSAPKQAVLVKGIDGNVYAQSERLSFRRRSGFGLLVVGGTASAHPELEIVSMPVDKAAANDLPPPATDTVQPNAPAAQAGTFVPGVSQCGDSLVALDGIIYTIVDNRSYAVANTTRLDATKTLTIATDDKPIDPKLAPWAASGEVPFVSKGDNFKGVVHWVDGGSAKSAAFWKPDFYYPSVWMTPGNDGYLYALASNTTGSLYLLRVSRDGAMEIALNLPAELTTGVWSELWPLTVGPDGTLYGVAGSINNDNNGGVFEIAHHR